MEATGGLRGSWSLVWVLGSDCQASGEAAAVLLTAEPSFQPFISSFVREVIRALSFYWANIYSFLFWRGMEPRAFHMQSKCSTTEQTQLFFCFVFLIFETGSM